jgi:hypothetical protein
MVDELLGPRRGPGRRPKLSDVELVCLAVAQVLLGCSSERRWLRLVRGRLGHLFPYLPTHRPTTGGCAGPARWSRWRSTTWPYLPRASVTSCAWSTRPRCRARRRGRRSSGRRWPGWPAMATARAITATSGGSGWMSWPVRRAPDGLVSGQPQVGRARGGRRVAGPRAPPAAAGAGHLGRQGVRRPRVRAARCRLWRGAAAT